MGEAVSFKGNRDGIVLLLDCSVDFELLCQKIVQKLWQSRSFLGEHTTLVVNSGDVSLDSGQQLALKILLQSLGHEVKYFVPAAPAQTPQPSVKTDAQPKQEEKPAAVSEAVSVVPTPEAESKETVSKDSNEASLRDVALREAALGETAFKESVSKPEATGKLPAGLGDVEHYLADGALVVRKNVRSGQNISYDGTLVVFGDVNAGAELMATGHILVLGTLRGVAHAGCKGNRQAIVYANNLNSLQLRIAELIARAPDGENHERNTPEIARIIDNQLVIEEI